MPFIFGEIARIIELDLYFFVLYGALQNRLAEVRVECVWEKGDDVKGGHSCTRVALGIYTRVALVLNLDNTSFLR